MGGRPAGITHHPDRSTVHKEAMDWVRQHATDAPITALDIGGRNINGSCRPLFPNASWTVLDIAPGAGVDIVADAATWEPTLNAHLVLSTEVFEHTAAWPAIVRTAYRACAPGGLLIATMAGPGRAVHSGVDGGPTLRPGEHYANVDPDHLAEVLKAAGWVDIVVDQLGTDVRTTARRGDR